MNEASNPDIPGLTYQRDEATSSFTDPPNVIEHEESGSVHATPIVVASGSDAASGVSARDLADHTSFLNEELSSDNQPTNSASTPIIPVGPVDGIGASPINTVQPSEPRNKLKVPLIVAAVVVVLALIVFGVMRFIPQRNPASNTAATASPAATLNPATSPDGAVQEFLQAIASGDAIGAINLLMPTTRDSVPTESPTESPSESPSATPADSPDRFYLTNEVLAKSNELAPITNIVVVPPDIPNSSTATVAASYDIGGQHVDTTYDVTLVGDSYRVNGTVPVDFSSAYAPMLNMTLNGIPMDQSGVKLISLFPGTYQLAISSPVVAMSNDPFTVVGPAEQAPIIAPEFSLTDQAPAILGGFAKKVFDDCLAETSLMNSCGWGADSLPGGAVFKQGSNVRVITSGSDDFTKVDWQIGNSPNNASATIKVTILSTCKDTKGREWHSSGPLSIVQIDFKDPDNMMVRFY